MENKSTILKIRNLVAGYGSLRVLNNLSLDIKKDEITVILGTNGNGKSTLLKCIVGLVKVFSGKISLVSNGYEIDITGKAPFEMVNLSISYVPEGRGLFPELTVEENLRIASYSKRARESFHENLRFVYDVFPILKDRKNQIAGTLSGGEQQMLAIARALISQPKILLIDEPSQGLAPVIVSKLMSVIKELARKKQLTVLMVEQNFVKAMEIADRICILIKGRIAYDSELHKQIDHELVRQYYMGEKS